MKHVLSALVALTALTAADPAAAICGKTHRHAHARPTADLPPDARPGECYARVLRPAEFREVTDEVVKREESERIRIIPAVYETRSEEVMVEPPTQRIVAVPAEYETVEREVEVAPATTEWRRGDCNPKAIVDQATGECWCLVEVPARTKVVRERIVAEPASTRTIEIPARYETVQKRVLVEPEREEREIIPAIVETVVRRELVSEESVDWVTIPCEPVKDDGHRHVRTSNDMLSMPRLGNRVH